jgi:hypothetical protein
MTAETSVVTAPHYNLVPKDFRANLKFRREMLHIAGTDDNAAAQIKTICNEDFFFYINTFGWTYSPKDRRTKKKDDNPVTPFITYDFQDEAMAELIECVLAGEDATLPKSRDMGASWMCLSVFEWFWHFRENLSFLLISRNEDYVDKRGNPKSLFWKIDFLHRWQPRWLLPTGRWLGDDDPERRLLHLGNVDTGSVIDGESTTGDAGRGDRRTAMLVDEHAAFDLASSFKVLSASRDTTDCRIFNSTPQGAGNGFYEVVHNTAARQLRLHWSSHPLKNRGLYVATGDKVDLRDDYHGMVTYREKGDKAGRLVRFPEEYPFIRDGKLRSPWYDLQCMRCVSTSEIGQELDIDFLGSDGQFFDPDFISILRKKYCQPPLLVGRLEFNSDSCMPKRFVEDDNGDLMLWLSLDGDGKVARDRQFVLGSDVSAGTGASNSVSCVVDRITGEKVGRLKTPTLRPTGFASLSIALAHFFNDAFMIWDTSGPTGKTFTMRVVRVGYGRIYYRRQEKKIGQQVTDEPGYYLNPKAKESLLEDYRASLAEHKFINRSDGGMKECLQFIRKSDGTIEHSAAAHSIDPSGAKTAHGDEVIADALASLALTEQEYERDPEEPEVPYGSLAWRQKIKAEKEAASKKDVLDSTW